MAVIDPSKRDLEKDPPKPGDWVKRSSGGKTILVRVPVPGLPTSWEAGTRLSSDPARVSR